MNALVSMVYCCLPQRLWFLLDQHHTPPIVGEDQMINYEDFLKVGEEAGPKCRYEHHWFFLETVFYFR